MNHFALHSIGWGTLVALTLLTILAQALDIVSGAVNGAKWFGATRWGAVGGILGAIVGLFFGIPGLFLGPCRSARCWGNCWAAKASFLRENQAGEPSSARRRASSGKLLIGLIMIGWFAVAALA